MAEPGLRIPAEEPMWAPGAAAASAQPLRGGVAQEVIEVDPERTAIRAVVEVGFSLDPPSSGT